MAGLRLTAGLALGTVAAVPVLKFGQDVNYPPYAFLDEEGNMTGVGYDIAMGLNDLCPTEFKIEIEQVKWDLCWSSKDGGTLGASLDNGDLDACMTYTHTQGIRNHYADFSWGILEVNKPAGLLVLLENGCHPKVLGQDDLAGKTVIDVGGWAPTADGLGFVENKCTGQKYSKDYKLIVGDDNDDSMRKLRNGTADAIFVYADQALHYQCKEGMTMTPDWDCDLWKGFGSEYAYVQTGQFGYVANGTTLALSKKGSGVPEKINKCLARFMETKEYYDICVKYDEVGSCYDNKFFPSAFAEEMPLYKVPTNEHTGDCTSGYCPCTVADPGSGCHATGAGLTPEDAGGNGHGLTPGASMATDVNEASGLAKAKFLNGAENKWSMEVPRLAPGKLNLMGFAVGGLASMVVASVMLRQWRQHSPTRTPLVEEEME